MIETAIAEAPPKRGRPKKLKNITETVAEQPAETPTFAEQSSDEPAENGAEIPEWPPIAPKVSADRLFEYWNALTPVQRKFGTVYLYRLHPKMQLQPWRGQMVNENCEKFNDEDGPLSREVVFTKRRIGIYLLRLSKLKSHGQVTQAELEIRGEWTADNMPILDIDKLDLSHPSNAEYIRILKVRGILKPEDKEPSGEGAEEMAATSVLGEIASKAFDKMGQQQNPQQPQSDIGGGVGTELVGLLREQITMNRPPAQQGTVKDQLEGLVTLAKTMTPPAAAAPDMGPYIELQRQNNELVRELMRKDVERAEHEAQKAREEAAQYKAALPQPKTVDEQFDELERAAKRFERMTGKKKVEDEPDEEKENPGTAAGFFGSLLGYVPAIRDLLHEVNIGLYNFRLNGSTAPPLNPATGQPGTEPLAPTEADDDEPPLSPADQAKMEHMQNVVNQLSALAQPMLAHLIRNKPGNEFARFVVENYGPQAFELVRGVEGGKETILAMIQQYPPVWNQIGPARLPQFTKFLDEFMRFSYEGQPGPVPVQ